MSDGEGRKLAFCLLLFEGNGGTVDELYRIRKDPNDPDRQIRGLCSDPGDCDRCPNNLMQQEISFHDPKEVTWVCPTCLPKITQWARDNQVQVTVPGHYSEGLCEYPWCTRTEDTMFGPARYSMFRQVVFGPIR